jgi:hypothetical protein
MAARSGMATLISRVRGNCAAGTADHTLGATSYWTDDQIQEVLDGHREDLRRHPLTPMARYGDNNVLQYFDYWWKRGGASSNNVEEASSGTTVWRVYDGNGSVIAGAEYSVNYSAGKITFLADRLGTAYLLDYSRYDIERASADVWEQKASFYADQFDISTDNHSLKRSQKYDHAMAQAAMWRKRARPMVTTMYRSDEGETAWD